MTAENPNFGPLTDAVLTWKGERLAQYRRVIEWDETTEASARWDLGPNFVESLRSEGWTLLAVESGAERGWVAYAIVRDVSRTTTKPPWFYRWDFREGRRHAIRFIYSDRELSEEFRAWVVPRWFTG